MLLKYISTHPLQCSKLLDFSAVSVKERFKEDLTAKVQKLYRVSLNKINCLTFDKKGLSRNTLIPEIIDVTHHHPHFSPKMISHYNNFWGSIFEYTVYLLIYRTAKNNYFGNCPGIIGTDFYRACEVSGIIRTSKQLHAS